MGVGAREEIATRGLLRITCDGRSLTRNDEEWSSSTADSVHVSMYPLALWLVWNWWRLIAEPSPDAEVRSADWRASHELSAVGDGYLWPRLSVASDGETVQLTMRPTRLGQRQPVRYLASGDAFVSLAEFESAATNFVEIVIGRLDKLQIRDTDLEITWRELCAERANPQSTRHRRLEALLGCDPDEASSDALRAIDSLEPEAGVGATAELAAALVGTDIPEIVRRMSAASRNGVGCRAPADVLRAPDLDACRSAARDSSIIPWERGSDAARRFRSARGLGLDPIDSDQLADLIGLDSQALRDKSDLTWLPAGIAIRDESGLKVLLRSRNRRSRRFELARLIGDLVAVPDGEAWYPATDLKTARQKVQRAFATHLLCPVDGLRRYLGNDDSNDAKEAAADYFDVSDLMVDGQLKNNTDL